MATGDDNITSQSIDWIIQHCASNENIKLLFALFNDVNFVSHPPFSCKTSQLINIIQLRNLINNTEYDELMIKLIEERNVFEYYHKLYPSILSNEEEILSLSKHEKNELTAMTAKLFENEIELKVQIILSTRAWNTNYTKHAEISDSLLLNNDYPSSVIGYITSCANGEIYINRIHQQLNYLAQQCTKPSTDIDDKIQQFLDKHSFNIFKRDFNKMLNIAQSDICKKSKDFLSRLSRADIDRILINDNIMIPNKFGLRTVVDVEIGGNWCPGSIIQRFDDGSLKIALHSDELDQSGRYQYDTHYKTKDLNNVILCINDDGEIETDTNPLLVIDTNTNITSSSMWSSPIKQKEIRKTKQNKLSQQRHGINDVLCNKNRNMVGVGLDEELLDYEEDKANTLKEKNEERTEEFSVNIDKEENGGRSPRRRKRSREEFENEAQTEIKETPASIPPKRRKIVTRSVARASKEQEKNEAKEPRQSSRLLHRKKQKEKEKKKKKKKDKKKKVQTKISSTKDKMITFTKNKNKNKKDVGEEQRWSDGMTEEMKKLDVKQTKKREIWKKEEEKALMKCYKKHDKVRKNMQKYAIWDQIKRDSEYCKYWTTRSAVSIRDKARALLGLVALKRKK